MKSFFTDCLTFPNNIFKREDQNFSYFREDKEDFVSFMSSCDEENGSKMLLDTDSLVIAIVDETPYTMYNITNNNYYAIDILLDLEKMSYEEAMKTIARTVYDYLYSLKDDKKKFDMASYYQFMNDCSWNLKHSTNQGIYFKLNESKNTKRKGVL